MSEFYRHDLELGGASLIGVDEAGRGALAGPVVIASVKLDYSLSIEDIDDSKKLSPARREKLYGQIIASALAWKIVEIDNRYIDTHNILQATLEGMRQAVCAIAQPTDLALIDGNKAPSNLPCPHLCVIGGDSLQACVAAASILAKVHRDRLMDNLHLLHPNYGFDRHKGYGTRLHLQAIREYGPCPLHRFSFSPISEYRQK